MTGRIALSGVLAVVVAISVAGCKTTNRAKSEPATPAKPVQIKFEPATSTVELQAGNVRYPNLFGPDSYAVWVGPEVVALKKQQAEEAGETIGPKLEETARIVSEQYVLIECHVESAFADSSIAYDAAGFRGIDVYLLMPDGRRVRPIQTVIASSAQEESQGALKKFARTNLIVFPQRDFWAEKPIFDAASPSVRLVLEGYNSQFFFEWPRQGAGVEQAASKVQDISKAVRTSFTDLYSQLVKLAHVFD